MDKDDFELSESNFSMSLASNAAKKVGGATLVSHAPFTGSALRERAATAVQPRTAPPLEVSDVKRVSVVDAAKAIKEDDNDNENYDNDQFDSDFEI